MSSSLESPEPPDATFTRARWIPRRRVEWARECEALMIEHGAVSGSVVYTHRHQARWRAQYLIRLMTELHMHERWELKEHTDQKDGGWVWTVEYLRRRNGNA